MNLQPLAGVKVVDFSTLLPGPMCTLLLAEAGADVVKVERPDGGDEMRSYTPRFSDTSVNFALLNRGKRSMALDLKSSDGLRAAIDISSSADVLVEQYRPGVMNRLGLGYDALAAKNPRLIYCSITGYGQTGPLASTAAHDLNYLAESGMLGLAADSTGMPPLPPALIADIAGGAYPAMMNILLALRQRDASGKGCKLDISMADSLFPLMYWGLGNGMAAGQWPVPGAELVTGGTPRYQVYRTADGRFLAAAPLEQKFWRNFLKAIEAPHLEDDSKDPRGIRDAISSVVLKRTAREWEERFAGLDVCVNVVRSLSEGASHPHFAERGLFSRRVNSPDGNTIPALPVPIAGQFRSSEATASYPQLSKVS